MPTPCAGTPPPSGSPPFPPPENRVEFPPTHTETPQKCQQPKVHELRAPEWVSSQSRAGSGARVLEPQSPKHPSPALALGPKPGAGGEVSHWGRGRATWHVYLQIQPFHHPWGGWSENGGITCSHSICRHTTQQVSEPRSRRQSSGGRSRQLIKKMVLDTQPQSQFPPTAYPALTKTNIYIIFHFKQLISLAKRTD